MSSEHYVCECGDTVDPKGTPHECPGTPTDRIAALENRVADLEAENAELRELVLDLLIPHVSGKLTAEEWNARAAAIAEKHKRP